MFTFIFPSKVSHTYRFVSILSEFRTVPVFDLLVSFPARSTMAGLATGQSRQQPQINTDVNQLI